MNDALLTPTVFTPHDLYGRWAITADGMASVLELARSGFKPPEKPGVRYAVSQGPVTVPGKGGKTVAVIRAVGVLMKPAVWFGTSTVQMRREIQQAVADPDVSGILLRIDSPGGTVAGMSELVADVKSARRKKPVWAHIEDLGASAAYELASQADFVFANSSTALVGSIGTLLVIYDQSAAAEQAGIKTLVFKTGPLKGAGWPGSVVTDEQKADFQKIVDNGQQFFDAAVKSGRRLSAAQLDAVRTGGIFPAPEAKELGLIDGIRPVESVLAELSGMK